MFLSGYEKNEAFASQLQKGVKPNLEYEIIFTSHV